LNHLRNIAIFFGVAVPFGRPAVELDSISINTMAHNTTLPAMGRMAVVTWAPVLR